jgi:hypothetical protein
MKMKLSQTIDRVAAVAMLAVYLLAVKGHHSHLHV